MVGGMLKSYPNFTPEALLYELSYQNLVLYSSILPSYDPDRKGKKGRGKHIDAADPANRAEAFKILSGI